MKEDITTIIADLRARVKASEGKIPSPDILEDIIGVSLQFLNTMRGSSPGDQSEHRLKTPLDKSTKQNLQYIINSLKKSQKSLSEKEARLRELNALQTATASLLTTIDTEALLSRILDAAKIAIPRAEKGMIHLVARDTGQLEMRASIGYPDPRIRRFRLQGSAGYIGRAVHEHKAILISDAHSYPDISPDQISTIGEVRAIIVAPLVVNDGIIGALSLESTQPDVFNEDDLHLLASFARTASTAIQNARLHSEVQRLAITDTLTGLYNRRGFYELGQREVERSRRYKRPILAILMDIDNFKEVNDRFGHATGDQVLRSVATRCRESLRRVDLVGRIGGDEFSILLPETDVTVGRQVAERVQHSVIATPISAGDLSIDISISMGVARSTTSIPDLEILLSKADAAMYMAKKSGHNRLEVV